MDSGFFTKKTLDYLEYIVAYRFTWPIKRELVGGKAWVDVADGIEMAETVFLAQSWTAPRRIVMVRQEIEKRPAATGKLVKQLCLLEDQWISGNTVIAISCPISTCPHESGSRHLPRTGGLQKLH